VPFSSESFALLATPNRVPAVSNKFTNKKEIMTLTIATSRAPKISSFKKIGAGLGGGSSDAATILMGINTLCDLKLSKKELMDIGLKLGADVPFFIFGENAWVEGIGETVKKITIPKSTYYICYPNFPISTESVFKSFELTKDPITMKITTYFSDKLEELNNDLERTITKKYVKMKELLDWMNNFGFAKISGTGSSVFVKIKDINQIKFLNEKKPIDTESFIVKGLSKHPFYKV